MLWIAALLVAWVVIDAVAVAVMARMASRQRSSAAVLPPLRTMTAAADNTPAPGSVR